MTRRGVPCTPPRPAPPPPRRPAPPTTTLATRSTRRSAPRLRRSPVPRLTAGLALPRPRVAGPAAQSVAAGGSAQATAGGLHLLHPRLLSHWRFVSKQADPRKRGLAGPTADPTPRDGAAPAPWLALSTHGTRRPRRPAPPRPRRADSPGGGEPTGLAPNRARRTPCAAWGSICGVIRGTDSLAVPTSISRRQGADPTRRTGLDMPGASLRSTDSAVLRHAYAYVREEYGLD